MFEQRKTITVNGVSFDMILVEGDKFCIGNREVELDDFYMAEIPVTQELYMAVMGPAHTGSYNMMPDNFDYLDPNRGISLIQPIYRESVEEHQKRLDREWREKSERESKERDRIRKLSASLPINNIPWLESIEFIKKLNALSGLCFALPSFEQWYFAASGGVESKGYKFAGSDDANAVGHFHKLSKREFKPTVYVMTGECDKAKVRKPATCWYEKPKHYKPNELGLYDMSGLVYEWLDEAGKVIGGSYHSDPEAVSRTRNYGYSDFKFMNSCLNERFHCAINLHRSYDECIYSGNLWGLRLVLENNPKIYKIPQEPSVISIVPDDERNLISLIFNLSEIGLLRKVIANKYDLRRKFGTISAFSRCQGNIYDAFICPQNLNGFVGKCFEQYHSRRKFLNHCKETFLLILNALDSQGYNLIIHDNLGLNLIEDKRFSILNVDFNDKEFRARKSKEWVEFLGKYELITNNPDVITIKSLSTIYNARLSSIHTLSKTILVEINETKDNNDYENADNNFLSYIKCDNKDTIMRLSLNCFYDFNCLGKDRFIENQTVKNNSRISNIDFDNTEKVNRLFCKRNKGGQYVYDYPESSGLFIICDEKFYILPEFVFRELWQN